MRKFPSLKYPNDPETDGVLAGEVVVTEKLDGANFRFTWDEDGELIVGTRNYEYHHEDESLPKAFEHAVDYINDVTDGWDMNEGWMQDITWFGEAMHLHSLTYQGVDYTNPSSGAPYFGSHPNVVLFDAWKDGGWVDWDEFEDMVEHSPFASTSVLDRGPGEELKDSGELSIPEESMFGGNPEGSGSGDDESQKSRDDSTTRPEGIVVRRVDGTVRAKKVSEDFKEQNAVAFEEPNERAGDAANFVAAYVTEARIEKEAHKLVDEGEHENLEMSMMEDLPRNVLSDAMAENGWDLLTSGGFEGEWDDDFKGEVRSKASKKCARVLKTLCQEF